MKRELEDAKEPPNKKQKIDNNNMICCKKECDRPIYNEKSKVFCCEWCKKGLHHWKCDEKYFSLVLINTLHILYTVIQF